MGLEYQLSVKLVAHLEFKLLESNLVDEAVGSIRNDVVGNPTLGSSPLSCLIVEAPGL